MKGTTKLLITLMVVMLFLFSACARYAVVTEETEEDNPDGVTVIGDDEDSTNFNDEETMLDEDDTIEDEFVEEEEESIDEKEELIEEEEEEEEPVEEIEEEEEEEDNVLEFVEQDEIDLASRISTSDEDEDELQLSFSKPFNEEGIWQTERGDAGLYDVKITLSDGDSKVSQEITIRVLPLNYPPVINNFKDFTVKENETIELTPEITDKDEDDELEISYSGWMTESTYTTTFDDSGKHFVTLTVSDGIDTVTEQIEITVEDTNRDPVLVFDYD